jgi:hypothetical protein
MKRLIKKWLSKGLDLLAKRAFNLINGHDADFRTNVRIIVSGAFLDGVLVGVVLVGVFLMLIFSFI